MIFRNLLRRKGRTFLTLVGIAIGVAAIVALGAVARGLPAGFAAMTQSSQADLVLTRADALSVLLSSIDEAVADELRTWSEVSEVDGVLLTNALIDDSFYLFLSGHDPHGFSITHFRIIEGQGLADVQGIRGKPLILGHQAAQRLDTQVGDALRITGNTFRIVGIYETGGGFEDGGAVVDLHEAQTLSLQPRHVSMLYIKLRSPTDADRLRARVERRFPDLALSTSSGFADQEQLFAILEGMAMGVAGLAIVIGGIVMTNTLFMSVFERTREIGLLRSLGWRRRQVLLLILGESLTLSLLGGVLGVGLGVAAVFAISRSSSWLGVLGSQFSVDLFVRALITAVALGLVGGASPAWWASRLLPLEALQYEGGSTGRAKRARFGGMTLRTLLRQRTRTVLTLLGIGVSIAAIVALGGFAEGMVHLMTDLVRAGQTDLFALQADVDADFSALDERVGSRIAARADVEAVSGMFLTAANTEKMPMLLVFGYHPREFAIRHFRIVKGQPLLTGRHQVIVGRQAAEQMGLQVGDTLRLLNSNLRVVGIYETGLAYEEIGVVIGLREAQSLTGKPRQVMYYGIKLRDAEQVEMVKEELEASYPEIDFALTSEVAESMSDFQVLEQMVQQISFLAVFIGVLGMLNTLLMSVLERTREIGVLRALGWRRRQVLGMILQESLVLGAVGGGCGILLGAALTQLLPLLPGMYGAMEAAFTSQLIVRAVAVALLGGAIGGLYPAWRATRMQPVAALRYE